MARTLSLSCLKPQNTTAAWHGNDSKDKTIIVKTRNMEGSVNMRDSHIVEALTRAISSHRFKLAHVYPSRRSPSNPLQALCACARRRESQAKGCLRQANT